MMMMMMMMNVMSSMMTMVTDVIVDIARFFFLTHARKTSQSEWSLLPNIMR